MRLLSTAATLVALGSSTLASPRAAIYKYATTSSSTPSSIPTLSPSNARLVLADQLGVSEYYSLQAADDDTISLLGQSSQQQALFTEKKEDDRKVLVFVEGVKDVKDILPKNEGRWQEIARLDTVPETADNAGVVADLMRSHGGSPPVWHTSGFTDGASGSMFHVVTTDYLKNHPKSINNIYELSAFLDASPDRYLSSLYVTLTQDSKEYTEEVEAASDVLRHVLRESAHEPSSLVLVVVPSGTKHSSKASWGTSGKVLGKRAQEEPISLVSGDNPSRPVMPMASGNQSLVNTTMPRYSGSETACNANTNSCSGHGKCQLKYKDDSKNEYWACKCSSTKESWGVQWWGGAACQKRDISVQFWLFAGFAIFGTAAVTWAVGLLYTMGDAELPSVLSAGVAPSGSRK